MKEYDSSPFPQALENIINATWETSIMHRINWRKEISLKCKNPSLSSNEGGNTNKERKSKYLACFEGKEGISLESS